MIQEDFGELWIVEKPKNSKNTFQQETNNLWITFAGEIWIKIKTLKFQRFLFESFPQWYGDNFVEKL